MRPIFLLSGPLSSGKSELTKAFRSRFDAKRVSTRELLLRFQPGADRDALVKLGMRLDTQTDEKWVLDEFLAAAGTELGQHMWLVDAVRTTKQVEHFRNHFKDRPEYQIIHVHLTAPLDVLRQRYLQRPKEIREFASYDEAKKHGTEVNIEDLAKIADHVLDSERNSAASLLARAVAGLGLHPVGVERCVDVLVGAQFGSEGKGNICAHIARDYGVLMRVGGPNAGHKVADPEYTYVQLPSGTLSNPDAKILVGAGATLSLMQVLKEIKDLKLTGERLSIDPQAIIIEESDVRHEEGSLEVIGSTKKGVGAATARKIMGRDGEKHLGSAVRLARDIPELEGFVRCTKTELEKAYAGGVKILLEGTQGTDLSIHHGSYPHVTSRETTASGCLADAGIAPTRVRRVIMVTRTYPIRVGGTSGPMMKPIDFNVVAERSGTKVDAIGKTEVGTISGKVRRMGEFDWEQVRRAAVLNGATDIALTFADYIDADNRTANSYEELTGRTKDFIEEVERVTGVPVSLITKDFGKDAVTIDRRDWK